MLENPSRYYAYTRKSIHGPFAPRDVSLLTGFSKNTLICPENALGQWREAVAESVFRVYLNMPAPVPPAPPANAAQAEERASRSLLEKAIAKNSALENEVKNMRREYSHSKRRFEEDLNKKDAEVKRLTEKLKHTAETSRAAAGEHPSWETLYKTLKKRSEEKLFEATKAVAEKAGEASRLRSQMQTMVDNYEASKLRISEAESKKISALQNKISELASRLEEKEMTASSLNGSMSSVLRKHEEFQRIMLDERRENEEQNRKFCEEIGALKGELNWKTQEAEKIKDELSQTLKRFKELETVDNIKNLEQKELYLVLHSKIKLLSGYFENLESRVKYAFKKA